MDDFNFSPYDSPDPYSDQRRPSGNARKPGVVTWYKVYAGVLMALYIVVTIAGFAMLSLAPDMADAGTDAAEIQFMGSVYAVMGIIFAIVAGIGLAVPRRPWGWIYAIVLICLGLTICCTLPACIALLIHWIKPETKAYFNMGS